MTTTPTPNTNSGETPTPRPVAPVTGMPEGAPVAIRYFTRLQSLVYDLDDPDMSKEPYIMLDLMPAGSRERLRALEAAAKAAHGLISSTVLGFILGKSPSPGAEAEVNRVVDLLARTLTPAPTSTCLCGHTLGEHVPDKDIGCTGFRAV